MKQPKAAAILVPLLLIMGCETDSEPTVGNDYQAQFTGVFEGARLQITEGEDTLLDSTEDVPFTLEGESFFLSLEDSTDLCLTADGSAVSPTYSVVCNYEGSAFSFAFEGGTLYDAHPSGLIIGPSTELEIWGQYSPVSEETLEVEIQDETPTPSSSPSPETTTVEALTDPYDEASPTPSQSNTQVILCTRVLNHSLYGQFLEESLIHIILRVVDETTCRDEQGQILDDMTERVVFEGAGIFSKNS